MTTGSSLAFRIRREAARLGLGACGFAPAALLEREARYLEQWLARRAHGRMDYMANHFDLRVDPRRLMPGARTILCVLQHYYPQPEDRAAAETAPKIAKYALGRDYHHVLREKLEALLAFIRAQAGDVQGRICVDSAPIMDKAWAVRAGLGWMGKHTNVIRKREGSFFFLGEIILDINIKAGDGPAADHCGSCTRCIDACPTQALTPYEIDASRCISYLTIELKEAIPDEFRDRLDGWAFGCDVCQDVCPWNRFAAPTDEPQFRLLDILRETAPADWRALTSSQFNKRLRASPLARIRLQKWLDNLDAAGA